jgi:hypothetical protein
MNYDEISKFLYIFETQFRGREGGKKPSFATFVKQKNGKKKH